MKGDVLPGEWECPRCGFGLSKRVLRASDGAVGINLSRKREVCPNDGVTLVQRIDDGAPTLSDAQAIQGALGRETP